jgi:hypothetical protein
MLQCSLVNEEALIPWGAVAPFKEIILRKYFKEDIKVK